MRWRAPSMADIRIHLSWKQKALPLNLMLCLLTAWMKKQASGEEGLRVRGLGCLHSQEAALGSLQLLQGPPKSHPELQSDFLNYSSTVSHCALPTVRWSCLFNSAWWFITTSARKRPPSSPWIFQVPKSPDVSSLQTYVKGGRLELLWPCGRRLRFFVFKFCDDWAE